MRFWRTEFSREFIEAIHLILFPHVDYSFIILCLTYSINSCLLTYIQLTYFCYLHSTGIAYLMEISCKYFWQQFL